MTDAPTLLLAALRDEMKPSAAILPANSNVITRITGIGAARMAAATSRLIDENHPARIILIGYSGALSPSLVAGDIIRTTAVIDGEGRLARLSNGVPVIAKDDGDREERTTILTVNHLVTTVQEKIVLSARHRAAAIDMESFALARLAAEFGIPLTILRAISDPADFALPPQIGEWVDDNGSPRIGRVVGALLRRPSLLKTLLALGRHTKTAARNLAAEVKALI